MRTVLDADGLRRELARRGMTQAELALVSGLSEVTVSHVMTGKKVAWTTVRKLARGLTVTPCLPGVDALILQKTTGAVTASSAATTPLEAERVRAQLPG
jgi:transcriptional regulator with XRE-family HTH domain